MDGKGAQKAVSDDALVRTLHANRQGRHGTPTNAGKSQSLAGRKIRRLRKALDENRGEGERPSQRLEEARGMRTKLPFEKSPRGGFRAQDFVRNFLN